MDQRRIKPNWQKEIALERIEILFQEADKQAKQGNTDLSDRYVKLARKIGMKYQVTIPRKLKMYFCRKCYSYLYPGKTSTKRIKNDRINIKCLKCGNIMKYPLDKKGFKD